MANWKITLLVAILSTIMAMSLSSNEPVREKRSYRIGNDRDKMARGAIGALYISSSTCEYKHDH